MENSKAHKMPMDVATLRKTFRERVANRIASETFIHNAEVHFRDGSVLLLEMPDIGKEAQRAIIRSRACEDAILVFHASELWVSELPMGDPRMAQAEKAQREGTIDQLPWVQECVDVYEESIAAAMITAFRAKIDRSAGTPKLGNWSQLDVVAPRANFRRYLRETPRVFERPDQTN
jgi:hypothetical protein